MRKCNFKKLNNSKVLVLCTTDNMITQFLVPHIKDLLSYGAQVDCVCHKTGPWFDELSSMGFNMIDIKMKRSPIKLANYKAYRALVKLFKQKQYDLIYCQQPVGGLLGRLLGRKFKVPVLYTAHGFFFFKGNNPLKNMLYKTAEKFLARYTDALITINDEDFSATQKWKTKHKYKISGIGVDLQRFKNEDFDKQSFKKSLGIENDDKVILSVAEVNKNKNYHTMLKTVASLVKNNPKIKYISCGTGVLLDEMKEQVKKYKLEKNVQFLGYRKDINKIMQISDVFFHQSYREGLPVSIMEAMYFGLPVVASKIRGNRDLVDNEKGGFLTNPEDVLTQADCIQKILSNENLSKLMSQYNQEKVKPFFIENVRQELKSIYTEIGLL